MKRDWEKEFRNAGAFWIHDNNPQRPYAVLTSGLISDGFFNCGLIMSEFPEIFAEAVDQLALRGGLKVGGPHHRNARIIGAAKGAINLAYGLSTHACDSFAYAEKDGEEFVFEERFSQYFDRHERFVLCEDTITTGGTVRKLVTAAKCAAAQASFAPEILAICNRSGLDRVDGFYIHALITCHMRTWKRGENPFTTDGEELIEPVRPKTHWAELTQEYP
jgi:orotate phosphoribosyltransferase